MTVEASSLDDLRIASGRIRARLWQQPVALIGAGVVVAWLALAVLAPWIAPYSPLAQHFTLLQPPSAKHLFGTDELGRDVLSRVIYGARISIPVSLLVVCLAVIIGTLLGLAAGYFGGWVDELIMRGTDLFFAFPAILLAMVVTASLGPSIRNAVVALVVVWWPTYARVVRGLTLSTANAEYVQASRLLGASARRTLFRVVLPNVWGPVVVLASLDIGNAVLFLATLSFLGLGAQPPTPEWGQMIASSINYFQDWWLSAFPGAAIFTIVLAFNLIGDALRDRLDPRVTSMGSRRA